MQIINLVFSSLLLSDSPRLMQVPHTPPISINQIGHGDMSSDARPSSDEEEGHSRMRSSSYAGSHSMNQEPVRSTLSAGMHSRPVQSGPICTTPGTCQNNNNNNNNKV